MLYFFIWVHPVIYRGPGFLAVVWFGFSHTPFSPSPVSKMSLFLNLHGVAGRAYLQGRGWGGGQGAKSYDPEKACPSINHSILSGSTPLPPPPPLQQVWAWVRSIYLLWREWKDYERGKGKAIGFVSAAGRGTGEGPNEGGRKKNSGPLHNPWRRDFKQRIALGWITGRTSFLFIIDLLRHIYRTWGRQLICFYVTKNPFLGNVKFCTLFNSLFVIILSSICAENCSLLYCISSRVEYLPIPVWKIYYSPSPTGVYLFSTYIYLFITVFHNRLLLKMLI